jgi:hypothetical protein
MKRYKLVLFITALFVGVQLDAQVSNETFKKAIYSTTDYFTSINQLSDGEFKTTFLVTGAHPTNKALVVSFDINIILKNAGDKYIIAAGMPALVPALYDEMCKSDGIVEDILDHHFSKLEDYSFSKGEDNNPVILLTKQYGSEKALGIMTGMVKTINKLSKTWVGIAAQQQKIAVKSVDEFMKGKITAISNDWLPAYVDADDLDEYVKDIDLEGAIGRWAWWYGNMYASYYNYPDRFEIYVSAEFEEDESTDDFSAGVEKFISKNKSKSETTIATLQNGKFYGVKLTYKYDGTIKGQDFVDEYNDVYSYAKRLEKVFY